MSKPPFPPKRPFGKSRPPFGKPKPHVFRKPEKPVPATLQGDRPKALAHQPKPENDLIYGVHAVAAVLANPKRTIVKLWATENGLGRLKEDGIETNVSAEIVHPRILDHLLTGQDAVHQGLVVEALSLPQPRLDQIPRDGLLVILDQVTDPHNVGAILRSCAAFGATAMVTTARHAPHETGVFFKSASGAYEYLPVVRVTNLGRAMEELKGYGFTLLGLDSEADVNIGQAKKDRPLALVLGAEGKGLRQKTRELCDAVVRLDMPGAIKSLNVSIAAAVSLYALNA
jgi:23S rRNA (guanosine2251-2'-O)-methyltransferase